MTRHDRWYAVGVANRLLAQQEDHRHDGDNQGALQPDKRGPVAGDPALVNRSLLVTDELAAPDHDHNHLDSRDDQHHYAHAASLPKLATVHTSAHHRAAGRAQHVVEVGW
jgi:hypothetical protein